MAPLPGPREGCEIWDAHLLELLTAHELGLLSLDLRVELLDILARGQIGQIRLVRLICLICSISLL